MSEEYPSNPKKMPDFYVQISQEGRHGKERITDVGAAWNAKNGYITGDTIAGRVILQPRAAREKLMQMRAERDTENQNQIPEQTPEMKP